MSIILSAVLLFPGSVFCEPVDSESPVGIVMHAKGEASAKTAAASRLLTAGDSVYQGEILETGKQSSIDIEFRDGTSFRLASESSLKIDEYLYDLSAGTGSMSLQVLGGIFRIIGGKIFRAKSNPAVVKFPVGTLGIRGTTVLAEIQGERSFVVLWTSEGESPDGHKIVVSNLVNRKLRETEITKIGFGCVIERDGKFPGPAFQVPQNDIDRLLSSLSLETSVQTVAEKDELAGLEKKLKLEGVLVEKVATDSTAIINGEVYQIGQTIGAYELIEVNPAGIRLREKASGKTGRVILPEATSKPAPPKESRLEKITDKIADKLFEVRPPEDKIVSGVPQPFDLQIIQKAAGMYSEQNPGQEISWEKLAAMSPANIAQTPLARLYDFQFQKLPNGKIEVYAMPKPGPFKLFYFMIDENGQVHIDKDKPATRESPALSAQDVLSEAQQVQQKSKEKQEEIERRIHEN